MRTYEATWLTVVGALIVVGVLGGSIAQPPEAMMASALFALLVGVAWSTRVAQTSDVTIPDWSRRAGRTSALTFVATVSVTGLLVAVGGVALLLLILVAASSPNLVRLWITRTDLEGRVRARSRRGAISRARHHREPAVSSLSDRQLCAAWCGSFTALLTTPRLDQLVRLVALRQQYLEELERRDPDVFARWLGEDARATSDPGTYFLTSPDPPADE